MINKETPYRVDLCTVTRRKRTPTFIKCKYYVWFSVEGGGRYKSRKFQTTTLSWPEGFYESSSGGVPKARQRITNSVFEIEFLKKDSVANKNKNKNPLKITDTTFMLVFLETQHLLPCKSCFVPYFVWMYTPKLCNHLIVFHTIFPSPSKKFSQIRHYFQILFPLFSWC